MKESTPLFTSVIATGMTFVLSSCDDDLFALGRQIPELGITIKDAKCVSHLARLGRSIHSVTMSEDMGFVTIGVNSGVLLGWGNNSWGELGKTESRKDRVKKVTFRKFESQGDSPKISNPNEIEPLILNVVSRNHVTIYHTNKGIYSLGNKLSGLLGYQPPEGIQVNPIKLHLPINVEIQGVSVSVKHAVAWDTQGRGYAWGINQYGILGIKDNRKRQDHKIISPEPIAVLENSRILNLYACDSCTFAISHKGKVFYWGRYDEINIGY